jgi:hypothetical protein
LEYDAVTVLEPTKFAEPSTPYVTDEADILHDMRDQIVDLQLSVQRIERGVNIIIGAIDRTEQMVGKIIEEVKPTIDELMNSQLFKMLGMKKKG